MREVVITLALGLAACARPLPVSAPDVSQLEWSVSRERLAEVRAEQPARPYTERIRMSIHDPRTGMRYEARGAVAVSPSRAARMMLVGPAGTTALDVWVTRDRFRFSVPAMHIEKRGGKNPEDARGLPVGMLRWWFLSPLDGRLLLARSTEAESSWLLKDGDATIAIRTDGRRFVAVRRDHEHLEAIEWLGRGLVPRAGTRGRYIEGKYGLRVDVIVEDVSQTEPDPAAFADPDEAQ
jgi:hypothetical protein